jgi:dihydrofolate reductase
LIISIIAAIASNGGIGKNNRLLCRIAEDMERFKTLTTGHCVIMGRKTFESVGKVLPNRTNIVISSTLQPYEGVIIASTLPNALDLCKDEEEVFVIGGESIYRQALPLASRIYLTKIHGSFDADAFFPQIDYAQWHPVWQQHFDCGSDFVYPFDFIIYECQKCYSCRAKWSWHHL